MARTWGEGSTVRRKDGLWQPSLQAGGVRRVVYGRKRSEMVDRLAARAKGT